MTSSTTDRRIGLTGDKAIKVPCKCATTANITLSGEQTIDGVTTSASRVLVKNQTTTTENGIYDSDSGTWTRALDADGNADWTAGTLVFVVSGTANGAGLFEQTTTGTITIGTSSLAFTKIATLDAGAVTQANVQNGQFVRCTSIAGTNTVTGTTVGTAPAALGAGQYVFFVPANTNTGATTFNRDALGAVSIFYNGAALIGGELVQDIPALIFHDGTQYQLMSIAASDLNFRTTGTVASAATINLDTAKPYTQITGSTGPVTAITLGNGRIRIVEFASTPTLTHGASLILPGAANITCAAGDTAVFVGEASSVVRCVVYQTASGNPVTGSSGIVTLTSVSGTNTITATGPSTFSAYTTNQLVAFTATGTNTGATTINISSVGAKNIYSNNAACVGGEIKSGSSYVLLYDGTQFQIVGADQTVGYGTVTTLSGASTTITGIPSWARRGRLIVAGASIDGGDDLMFRIGSGSLTTSGYTGAYGFASTGGQSQASHTGGIPIGYGNAARIADGVIDVELINSTANTWVVRGQFTYTGFAAACSFGGAVSLSSNFDRMALLTTATTAVFDGGSIIGTWQR